MPEDDESAKAELEEMRRALKDIDGSLLKEFSGLLDTKIPWDMRRTNLETLVRTMLVLSRIVRSRIERDLDAAFPSPRTNIDTNLDAGANPSQPTPPPRSIGGGLRSGS